MTVQPPANLGATLPPTLQLPLRWVVVTDLPTMGPWFTGPPEWPEEGRTIVACERWDGAWSEARAQGLRPDVVFVEARDGRHLEALAGQAADDRAGILAFVPDGLPSQALLAASTRNPALVVVPMVGRPRSIAAAAAQETAELVRRRVYRQLLAHWLVELRDHENHLTAVDPALRLSLPPRPSMAPLSVVESAHLAGVLGLWFTKPRKVNADLGLSYSTLRAAQERLREHHERWLSSAVRPAEARVLIVEDDLEMAKSTARAIEQHGAGRTGFDVQVVQTARAAQAAVERHGAPDLLWLDVNLERKADGLEFATWLRRQGGASVLLGKTFEPSFEVTRRLLQLGALTIYSGGDAALVGRQVEEASLVSALGREIATVERMVDTRLGQAMELAGTLADARRVRQLVTWADEELAPTPEGTGKPEVTLAEARLNAVEEALDASGGVREAAARLLQVSAKTVKGLTGRDDEG